MTAPTPNADESEHVDADAFLPVPEGLFCPECDYDLRGLTSERCPECGFELEALRSLESPIPWVHRRKLGRFRAYWKTVWMVTFRHKRFCREIARPVHLRDSQLFRWITILHVYAPFLLATGAWALWEPKQFAGFVGEFGVTSVIVAHMSVLLFWVLTTGIPSCLLHPRHLPAEHEGRAGAIGYYTCASLAYAAPAALPGAALTAALTWPPSAALVLGLGLLGSCVLAYLMWGVDLGRTSRAFFRRRRDRLRFDALTGLLILATAGYCLLFLPLAWLYVLAIFRSLG